MRKNIVRILCIFIVLSIGLNSGIAFAQEDSLPFDLESKSVMLLDHDSGEIIYEKNADEKLAIASITKVMTILLALEAIENNLISESDQIVASAHAQSMGGSTAFLEEGETFPVSTILKAIVVASANDASVAIAEKISGSHEGFVEKMNQKAKELGMTNTNFSNCTGLPDENHYSTARDIAIMSRALLDKPLFFQWSSIWLDDMRDGKTMLKNTNNLVRFYEGCDGVKTGFTNDALHCISATAKRGNLRLISIILAGPTSQKRFDEASKLLDYGFANYDSITLFEKGQEVDEATSIYVKGGQEDSVHGVISDDLSILVKKESPKDFEFEWDIPDSLEAPIFEDQKVGSVTVKLENEIVGEIDILANRDIEVASIFDLFNKILDSWLRK